MPDPTVDQVAPGGVVQLQNAPAGLDDATFDSLFPSDGVTQKIALTQTAQELGTQQTQQTPTTQQPAIQATDAQPYIKGDKSVYKTAEAAIEGINQKDALIEQLRQRYALTTGIDPISGQPVGQAQQQVSDDYNTNPAKYLDDLFNAAKQGGPQAYVNTQQKLIMDTLKPFAPALNSFAKNQALEAVASSNVDAAKFVSTPNYARTLEANPDLAGAIATAESDYRFHSRLPGLYKLAHLAGQGMQLPELLKANTSQTQTQTQTQQVRTTAQPTTLSAPTQQAQKPSFSSHAGIKATIAEMEARGAKLDF